MAPSSTAAEPVPAILDFSGTTLDGRAFAGSSLQGKPVLIWFWAPWCPTCKGQIPEVTALAARFEGRLAVVGVGSLDSADAIRNGREAAIPGVTQLLDPDGSVWRHFEVTQQSSFVVLDAKGRQQFSTGYGGAADLADRVAAVVG